MAAFFVQFIHRFYLSMKAALLPAKGLFLLYRNEYGSKKYPSFWWHR